MKSASLPSPLDKPVRMRSVAFRSAVACSAKKVLRSWSAAPRTSFSQPTTCVLSASHATNGSLSAPLCWNAQKWLTGSKSLSTLRTATTAEPVVAADDCIASNDQSGVIKNAPTFQEAISQLQQYWAKQGCIMWLPHNSEVGAGTMNPATFLRVLGPEPWNVCYPEPSIRPDDSRYGDNPNRVQRHTQFQVILKPDPGNAQELYLGSLSALGIDVSKHDVRFVEDNWESPVLGAWGLGWEVWLDGMEVTQFTYFQQAGGKVLEAPAVEITYGLERILMALQGVKHFKDIKYNDQVTYGELFLQNEYEMSVFNLDKADITDQRQRFELYEGEAWRMIKAGLPVAAYEQLLKLSHAFNILDARGAVGVTERANRFAAMRALAREVTGAWLARREELGHPLGVIPAAVAPAPVAVKVTDRTTARDFVLEIGTEELPPDDVASALEWLKSSMTTLLEKLRLSYSDLTVEGTPRRLAVLVKGLAAAQTAQKSKVRGPPAKAAFTPDGKPTKALEGFCKKNGVSPDSVVTEKDAKGVEYVFASVSDGGQAAAEVLTHELPGVLSGLSFRKNMRWQGDTAFSRPIRWLLALHGDTPLPFTFAGLQAGNITRVLRNAPAPEVLIGSAEQYKVQLTAQRITLSGGERADAIWREVVQKAAEVGGVVPESTKGDLLEEVTNLVESPTVVLGTFSPEFLALPQEVLVMVMRKHQRYFPVFKDASGTELLPFFITVANGPIDVDAVAAGNAAVVRARFEDATFFYNEDLKQPLEAFRPKLSGTMFQKLLGSMLDKADRTEKLVPLLAAEVGVTGAALDFAKQAAHLCKADLATSTVTEMTALAGTMGRHYAAKQGLPVEVSEAIFESALPRNAGDILPSSAAGILVAVADRLDSLVGLSAAGCAPTGANDPYGLRRSAYGMLQALVSNNVHISMTKAISLTAGLQPVEVTDKTKKEVFDFVSKRLEQLMIDDGLSPEAVRAVLSERGDDPALAVSTGRDLKLALEQGESSLLKPVMAALARPTRIVRGKTVDPSLPVDPSKFELQEEADLHNAYVSAASKITPAMPLPEFLQLTSALSTPIDNYFEKVFVMCEDEAVKNNRLALLRDIAGLTSSILDFTQLPGY